MTVVLTVGEAFVTYAGFVTTTAGEVTATGADEVVVVVVTARVLGGGGGGAETKCDSGSVAQPARKPRAPQQATAAKGDRNVRIVFFIVQKIHR
jgi:hypothetical protein